VLAAAGALVVVAVVAVVLVAVLGGGGAKTVTVPVRGTLTDALPGAADVHRQLNGIAQARNVLGRPSAPATLIEYVDLQCPYCAEFERQVMPQVISRYVRTGKLKIVARPIAFIGEDSRRGQAAVLAAARQNRMFDLMQLLYLHQGAENTGWLDENLLRQAAASVPGVEVQGLLDGRGATGSEAKRMESLAVSDSVRGTPTILVGKTAGSAAEVRLSGPDDAASVTSAIERTLAS
jgi:protein-disulfide isomerase